MIAKLGKCAVVKPINPMILCRSADPPGDPPHAPHPDVVSVGTLLQEKVYRGTEIGSLAKVQFTQPSAHLFPEHAPLDGAGVAAHLRVRAQDIDGVA